MSAGEGGGGGRATRKGTVPSPKKGSVTDALAGGTGGGVGGIEGVQRTEAAVGGGRRQVHFQDLRVLRLRLRLQLLGGRRGKNKCTLEQRHLPWLRFGCRQRHAESRSVERWRQASGREQSP